MSIAARLKPCIIPCIAMMMQGMTQASTTAFITVDEAVLFSAPGYTQSLNLINALGNTYLTTHPWQHDDSLILGLGFRTHQHNELNMNTSVRYLPRVGTQVQGNQLQLRSPQLDNLAYAYNITNQLILIEHLVTWTKFPMQPGLLIGLGRTSNRVGNYHEIPLNPHASPGLDLFSEESSAQFAVELGAVLDYAFKDVIIECAYRYIDAGQGQLGLSPLQNTFEHLSTGPLHYHTISLGVRFERIL